VSISVEPDEVKSFISVQGKTLKFAPKYSYQVGTKKITIFLTNDHDISSNCSINVTVI
jgi:hypothetical protein